MQKQNGIGKRIHREGCRLAHLDFKYRDEWEGHVCNGLIHRSRSTVLTADQATKLVADGKQLYEQRRQVRISQERNQYQAAVAKLNYD